MFDDEVVEVDAGTVHRDCAAIDPNKTRHLGNNICSTEIACSSEVIERVDRALDVEPLETVDPDVDDVGHNRECGHVEISSCVESRRTGRWSTTLGRAECRHRDRSASDRDHRCACTYCQSSGPGKFIRRRGP